uniref:tRNA pseudouridine synthase n=1 Tax=Kalanchoe fedtschenkoi TaxID=63787 RepID=A0A7N0TIS3_KALFE
MCLNIPSSAYPLLSSKDSGFVSSPNPFRGSSRGTLALAAILRLPLGMEHHKMAPVHYNHTDSCKHLRWTAKESYEYMYSRNWQPVVDFYSNVVSGNLSVSSLFPPAILIDDSAPVPETAGDGKKSGRWARFNYRIVLAYNGNSFDGWQKQPGLHTVQGTVEASLGRFVDDKKAQSLKARGCPLEGVVVVAGRTDKGVTALNQVSSFHTWRSGDLTQDIADAIGAAAPGSLRVVSVTQVSRSFHPNFSAEWRRYMYAFPLCDEDHEHNYGSGMTDHGFNFPEHSSDGETYNEELEEFKIKPRTFCVSKVDRLLRQLEGKLLSYKMFARDTKPSRNEGPPTECFMYHARATQTILPSLANNDHCLGTKVLCVELVANRFLRRMVRVLVATSIREAAAGAEDDALLKLMEATCRRATAPPAPPDGLCLVDVGYVKFDRASCFIS